MLARMFVMRVVGEVSVSWYPMGRSEGWLCRTLALAHSTVGLSDVLSPESSLTKIWKFSEDGDEDVDVEEALDEEREVRMLSGSVGDYG